MGFSTPSYALNDLFSRIDRGDLQLPDFQRNYFWDVDQIRSLIVSVLRGFPVGVLMALDTRGEDMRFRPRPLQGAPDLQVEPGLLLLDGQQRLTTLYHSLRGDGYVDSIDFRSKRVRRKFYVDVAKAISAPVMPDEAVFSVDELGQIKSHFAPKLAGGINDVETALAAGCIPVSMLLGTEGVSVLFDLADVAGDAARDNAKRFHAQVGTAVLGYEIPMIRLDRETAKGGVGSIFAHANTSGLQMDVFDLLTAVFAADGGNTEFSLGVEWERIARRLRAHPALDEIGPTEFLTAVSLLVNFHKGKAVGHREDILNLSLDEYLSVADEICLGFEETAEFLKQRCIFSSAQVPYTAQLIPLAVILTSLSDEVLSHTEAWNRLNRWFWSGIFGELYGAPAVIARSGRDTDQVTAWVNEVVDPRDQVVEPKTIRDTEFYESRLHNADSTTGVWKGLFALLMSQGARDWRTGEAFDQWTFEELGATFRPIFPAKWCSERSIDPAIFESVLNRTPMGKRTEVVIGDTPPSRYLGRLQSKSLLGDQEFDQLLETHSLTAADLHAANATSFFNDRRERFLGIIEVAIGKSASKDVK